MRHCDKNQILTDKQHGFRDRRSCETQLISTIQEIARNMTRKGQVDVILLDFAKAFDKVPHHRLLHKFNYYGVKDSTLRCIESFLSQRKQSVLLDGTMSTEAFVLSCVLQGTFLGPLLFLTFYQRPTRVYKTLRCQTVCGRLPPLQTCHVTSGQDQASSRKTYEGRFFMFVER